ncbi:beta-propeller fold lactonase family protein [Hydrogenophaga sp. 2FB]|uniref:lactonase family protein n=1 Tax=Hydrogenophaga sp. 2FB TaxID=2502187 RepID=UPI0010F7B6AB|nr:beta-propeller fold lactonase family protein [Hydrogenophaga sp. 2FB]
MRPAVHAYVGARTARERGGRGDGITVFRVDADSGALEPVQVVGDVLNPSFLVLNRRRDRLYTVHGDGDAVSVFAVEEQGARLRFLQRENCGGQNPVHAALSPDERCLVVSNHAGPDGGSVAVMPLDPHGALGAPVQGIGLPGSPGPHRTEQKSSRPHASVFDPTGRFVLTLDKGQDRVFCFRFEQGRLQPAEPPWVDTRQGAGPRLAAFHPTEPFVYVVNDLDSTVATSRFDADTGALRPLQVLSTLSDAFTGNSRAATVAVSPDGARVHVSNRGEDSIAAFAVSPETGFLRALAPTPSAGKTPRFFTFDPTGRWVYALNEASDTIVAFRVDPRKARLVRASTTPCGSPICMVFQTT